MTTGEHDSIIHRDLPLRPAQPGETGSHFLAAVLCGGFGRRCPAVAYRHTPTGPVLLCAHGHGRLAHTLLRPILAALLPHFAPFIIDRNPDK